MTLSVLIWMWSRRDVSKSLLPFLSTLIVVCSYQGLLVETLVPLLGIGAWTALLYKALFTGGLAVVALQLYVGVTANDEKY